MAKLLLDNLMKTFRTDLTFTAGTAVSKELDLDIPRGYVIRIHEVLLKVLNIVEDIEGISADKLFKYFGALVKDPDDTTSTNVPTDRVDHDVLVDLGVDVCIVAGTAGDIVFYVSETERQVNFTAEGLDVITARNMRLNVSASGTDSADATEAFMYCVLHYTLERITDSDILALLDII